MDIIPNSQIAGYKDLETTFTKRNVYNSGLYGYYIWIKSEN